MPASTPSTGSSSSLMSRFMLAVRAGWQFAGKRKLYDVFGYPTTLTTEALLAKYQRQDLSSRVVDMPPEDMWAEPPTIDDGNVEVWNKFVRHTDYFSRVVQADKLLAFGHFSVIWLGLPGDPEAVAPRISNPEQILYLQSYGAPNVEIDTYETNIRNPRFGQPLSYKIKVNSGGDRTLDLKVHHSRIIHIVDKPLQGQLISTPRLEQVYNVLDDLLKVGGGSAELYWLTANRGMQVDIDKDMDLDEADATALSEELDEFQHQLRRYIRTRGVTIKPLGSEVADPRGVFGVLISTLAGATSIPQRILVGAEAGQLASEQDRANWAVYMLRRRKIFAEPYILRPTIARLEALGLMTVGTSKTVEFTWPAAFKMNPLEDAQTLAAKGRAIANFSRRNQFDNALVTDEECRRMLDLPDTPPAGETMPMMPEQPVSGDEDDNDDEDDDNDSDEEGKGKSKRKGKDGVGSGDEVADHPTVVRNPPTGDDVGPDSRVATSRAGPSATPRLLETIRRSVLRTS